MRVCLYDLFCITCKHTDTDSLIHTQNSCKRAASRFASCNNQLHWSMMLSVFLCPHVISFNTKSSFAWWRRKKKGKRRRRGGAFKEMTCGGDRREMKDVETDRKGEGEMKKTHREGWGRGVLCFFSWNAAPRLLQRGKVEKHKRLFLRRQTCHILAVSVLPLFFFWPW